MHINDLTSFTISFAVSVQFEKVGLLLEPFNQELSNVSHRSQKCTH